MRSRLRTLAMVALAASTSACGGSESGDLFTQGGAPALGGGDASAGTSGSGGTASTGTGGESGASTGGSEVLTGGSSGTDTGGATGTGGAGPEVPEGGTCDPSSKACGGICVPYDPFVGCAAATCEPCPNAKDNAFPVCINDACGYQCIPNHHLNGINCVPLSTSPDGGGPGEPADGGIVGSSRCPAAQPTTGDICIALPFPCTYGAVQCACLAAALIPFWYCQ